MKKNILFLVCFLVQTMYSQDIPFQDTKGALEVSSGGQASYTLPIALPPSIKNVAPSINLVYNSGARCMEMHRLLLFLQII